MTITDNFHYQMSPLWHYEMALCFLISYVQPVIQHAVRINKYLKKASDKTPTHNKLHSLLAPNEIPAIQAIV